MCGISLSFYVCQKVAPCWASLGLGGLFRTAVVTVLIIFWAVTDQQQEGRQSNIY